MNKITIIIRIMKFYLKKDAILKLKKGNNKDLKLIQEDICEEGNKRFHIISNKELYDKILEIKGKNKVPSFYESWIENTNLVFALDIDLNDNISDNDFDKILVKNINNVKKYAKEYYDYDYNIEEIIVLKTKKREDKQSSHIIFRGLSFENHLVCKNFFFRIIKDSKLEYCDSSIYGKTCLRTCFSTKKGKDYPFVPYKLKIGNKYTSVIENYENEYDYFENSLVTYVKEEDPLISKDMIVEEFNIKEEVKKIEIKDNAELEQILNSLPQDYCDEYIKWNRVGMALFSMNENYFEMFNKWSSKSSKYNYQEVFNHWSRYRNSNFNKNYLGLGSLIHWAKQSGANVLNKNIEQTVLDYPESKIIITENDNFDVKHISQNKLTDKLFENIIDKKFIGIQSEKGTGKTSNLIKALFENNKRKEPESILFVSSRRTFGIKLSADLKKYGFKLYSDINEHYIYDKRVIVQIDSLLRVDRDKFDLVIIDECESLARYCTSSHFTKNVKASTIVSNLEFRINDADNIIIMDADLSDRCINYYKKIIDPDNKLGKNDLKIIINKFTPYQSYKLKYMDYNNWLNELEKQLIDDKKIVIPMASNNKAKDLYERLSKKFTNKKIILIHKETSEEEKLKKLLNVNNIWIKYDVVIYTPTVCMGVSFDPEHFDNIFAYGCHNSLGAQEFCQMLHRVRHIRENNIYISFDYFKYHDPIEDIVTYDQVEEMLCNDYYLTYNNLHNNLINKKFKRVGNQRVLYYPHKNEPIYDLYVRNSIENIINKLNFTAAFFGYAKFKNYQYEFYQSEKNDDLVGELKNLRKTREEEEKNVELDNIFNAKNLDKDEYLEKCMRKDNFMSENDYNEIKKYNFLKTYNLEIEELTKELLEKYYDKKLMLTYNNLSNIIKSDEQNTNDKLKIMLNNQISGDEYRNCYQDLTYKNKYTYHYYALRLLEYSDFDINDIDSDKFISKDKLDIDILNKKIENKTIYEFVEEEKYGLYKKFDNIKLVNKKILNTADYMVNLINNIITKQYNVKFKCKKVKDEKFYFLTTNKKWDELPSKIKPKNVIEYKKTEKNYENIIKDLDNGLFLESDSDEE